MPTDDAAFKTPTLRDVARRAPYMHDGSFETLEDVVRQYAKGATKNPNLDPQVRPFDASDGDVADLVAFLRSLTGETRSAAAPDWKARAKTTRIRLLDAAGHPIAGLRATLTPAGDRLPGDSLSSEAPREVVSDAEGLFTYVPARRTHMRLDLPAGLRPPGGGMVPDTCEKLDLRLAVAGRADLVLLLPRGAEAPSMLTANAGEAPEQVDLRKPDAVARPMAFAFLRPRPVFVKDAEAVLAGMRLVRYRAWIETGTPKEGTLRVPLAGQPTVRIVDLRPGAETRIALLPAVPAQPAPPGRARRNRPARRRQPSPALPRRSPRSGTATVDRAARPGARLRPRHNAPPVGPEGRVAPSPAVPHRRLPEGSSMPRFPRLLALAVAASLPLVSAASVRAEEQVKADEQVEFARDQVYPALVNIGVVCMGYSGGRVERFPSAGSGVIVSPAGHVLTNYHVAGDAAHLDVPPAVEGVDRGRGRRARPADRPLGAPPEARDAQGPQPARSRSRASATPASSPSGSPSSRWATR